MIARTISTGLLLLIWLPLVAAAQDVREFAVSSELDAAFAGAQVVDLRTSKVSSVGTLRDVVKIPAPSTPVLVRTFSRATLPAVLQPAFEKPGTMGVTIRGRYVAVIAQAMQKENDDILRHELVHAYIALASPKPLPFWFHEGSAVHFSTDKGWKFYGEPSKKEVGVMVGRTVVLNDTYKQKLQSFHYLIERVGKDEFYRWYKQAVLTGTVDARPLVGLSPIKSAAPGARRSLPIWLIVGAAVVIIVVAAIGFHTWRQERDVW